MSFNTFTYEYKYREIKAEKLSSLIGVLISNPNRVGLAAPIVPEGTVTALADLHEGSTDSSQFTMECEAQNEKNVKTKATAVSWLFINAVPLEPVLGAHETVHMRPLLQRRFLER